jgi:hypothetical protein
LINKFNEQNQIIEQLRVENSELEKAFHEKTMEAMDLKEQLEQNKSFDSNQKRDLSLKEKKKHGKIIKSKNREISKLKNDISTLAKNISNLKSNMTTNQNLKLEKDKDRIRISDLIRQRTGLESELNKIKSDMFAKNKEVLDQRQEIEDLKRQLADQKEKVKVNKDEAEKYKELYANAKTNTTPFSDSKFDMLTEATQGMKKTPTDLKSEFIKKPKQSEKRTNFTSVQEESKQLQNEDLSTFEKDTLMERTIKDSEEQSKRNLNKVGKTIEKRSSNKTSKESEKHKTPEKSKSTSPYKEKEVNREQIEVEVQKEKSIEEKIDEVPPEESDSDVPNITIYKDADVVIRINPYNYQETEEDLPEKVEEINEDVEEKFDDVEEDIKEEDMQPEQNTPVLGKKESISEEKHHLTGKKYISPEKNKEFEDDEEEIDDQIDEEFEPEKVKIKISTPGETKKKDTPKKKETKDEKKFETPKGDKMVIPKTSILQTTGGLLSSEMPDPTENLNDSSEEVCEEYENPRVNFRNRVSIVDIPKVVKEEFKLILQNQKIPFEKMRKIFPKTQRIALAQLIDHFKQFNRFEVDAILEQVCRYLVENDAEGDVISYDRNADIDKIAIGIRLFHHSFQIQKQDRRRRLHYFR